MLAQLKDGDKLIFLNNLRRDGTYGNIVEVVDHYWLTTKSDYEISCQTMITEDSNLPIFPDLNKIYWDFRKLGKDSGIKKYTRYYSYVLLNNEYKLVYFGRKIFDKIIELRESNLNETNYMFNVRIEQVGMGGSSFSNYDKSYFDTNYFKKIKEDFLETKTLYLEDHLDKVKWTNDNKYNSLIHFLKSYDIKFDSIKAINIRQRSFKLQRILQEEMNNGKDIEYLIKNLALSYGYDVQLKKINDETE